MPSTAWSSGASSNTMLAALPPSSRVSALSVPATPLAMRLPTSVEPVNATLSTSGWVTRSMPISPGPVTMLTTPGGRSAWRQTSAKSSAESGRRRGRLEHDRVAGGERRRDLPGQHQQREVPRDDLGGDAERPRDAARERVLELVRPARVVPEVGRRERDVDVAALLDRLARVHRLEDGELAAALLEDARDPEQVLRAFLAGERAPRAGLGAPRGTDRPVDVGRGRRGRPRRAVSSVAGLTVANVAPSEAGTSRPSMNRP